MRRWNPEPERPGFAVLDGERTFRYMKAIPAQPVCTACRGADIAPEVAAALDALYPADRARGFTVGDIGGTTFEERRDYYDTLRLLYQDASSVIHARKPKHVARDSGLLDRGRELCRQAIRTTLAHGQPDWRDVVLGKA